MNLDEFISFINVKTGMSLLKEHVDIDLTNLSEWDSLTFVYMLMEIEKKNKLTLNVERILQCTTLHDIYQVVSDEVAESL
ncbi:phosphopantetheine-binding protein [Pectobacteriaceae bacterium CE70]|uniref:Carrier domain-containing protein n=1 Tax=Serratia sp. (strain ATCC 39006) TaxID=104623 RepID=A0A2I5T9G1_SERS3|nr:MULTISPECIES: phosphopantetheine-binding protein [Enterobacterales]WJV64189.1 phosphopantetheine-binding protein [Pectobacteriaceae bacterium C52]WJV65381.1 phosphopantetheine-binding protein [Pectobacteriaceae bacterium CE70]WJY09397.1 phosphopantetheine-binding protein [Pectobacteriaceae bacterium C80]WJY13465.1 phosphopantetheine-binding protein [Pectobacteriaceae bacterium CE90]AUH01199.1 hypothetical protein CWC46_16085 [Serratia sp. ATCC 39006]